MQEAPPFLRGADGLFGGKQGRGVLFLTGVENTANQIFIPYCSWLDATPPSYYVDIVFEMCGVYCLILCVIYQE
jgi:hypothetical protein